MHSVTALLSLKITACYKTRMQEKNINLRFMLDFQKEFA